MVFNPLFDEHPRKERINTTAAIKSPVSDNEMVEAFCGDIPVMVDLVGRAVLPVKKK